MKFKYKRTPLLAPLRIPEEQLEIDMVVGGSDFNILNRRSSSSSTAGGREMLRTTGFDHLPDDILTQILVRISAEDIVDSTKFVCRKRREITRTHDFAYAHLHRSTPGLLVQNHDHLKLATYILLAQGNQVQISDFIYISRDRFIWTGCNGLTLQPKVNDIGELMITNPVTKHRFDLPPFIFPTIHPNYSSAIAYVATRKEYKVVRTYYPDRSRLNCAILTVGVDNSWRLVDTQHLSPEASGKLDECPLVTEGFVHWVQNYDSSNNNNHILSLNMETEVITQILSPQCNGRYTYLSTAGSSLSLLIAVARLKWEVWEMKPSETGEYCWTKLTDIDLEAHKGLLNESCDSEENFPLYKPAGDEDADCVDWCLSPSGWLKYPEVITFFALKPALISCRSLRLHVVYDVETKDVSLCKSDYCCHPHLVHTNSLVRIC